MRWCLPLTLASFLLLVGCVAGCGEQRERPAPSTSADACQRIGDRCVLPSGPIGVCNDTGQTDCEAPPCLACMPQH